MKKPLESRTLAVFFGVAGAVLFWTSVTSYLSTRQLIHSYEDLAQTHQAVDKIQHVDLLMASAESSVRGYVATGETARLSAFQYAKLVIPYELKQIDALLSADGAPEGPWPPVSRLFSRYLADLTALSALRQSAGAHAAAGRIAGGDRQRAAIDSALTQFQAQESALLEEQRTRNAQYSEKSVLTLVLAGCLSAGLLGWAFMLLRRETEERHSAEFAALRTETFLDSVVERIPYMILVKEAENLRLTLVNKAAEKWLGRPRADLLGSNDLDLRPAEEARAAMEKERQVLGEGKPVDIEEEKLALSGQEERVLHTQKIPLPDSAGNPAYLLTISEDVTQRKLAERMLELSRDAAVESARLKSEFIRNMSHEIRTPLSVVSGMTDLLLGTELSPDQKRFAGIVQRAAAGLITLSKSVLDFSKIEAGAFSLEVLEFSPRQMVDDVVAMLSEQAKAKGLHLTGVVENDVPSRLWGDPIRLRQVLTQMIGNAVKFTPRGDVTVRAAKARQNDDHVWLNIKITDTGIGISADVQKHLFQAFRQGDGSPTRKFGGTGLGLAISKRITELMGGDIGFESVPEKGSAFWVTVPFLTSGDAGGAARAAPPPGTRARVLIVDENETVRQLLQQELRSWALASEAVSSGQTALELLRRERGAGRPFAIVIIDMQLPDMDGVMFAKIVKSDPALAGVKLLVMTGGGSSFDAEATETFGFAGVITKPPKSEDLHERLASLIDAHKSLDPGRIP